MTHKKIEIFKVNTGIYWISIPEANFRMLCACPADTVKHLKKRGLIDKTEKDGIEYETGPNAILLSDIALQNGMLSNLAEFPLLQMLYIQGMLIPNHPNNTGEKPLLLGSHTQIQAQMEYFYRGNYGLLTMEEILATGVSQELAELVMHIKLKFAFGELKPSDQLVDQLVIEGDHKILVRNDVYIRRKDINIYEISYEDEEITIDLNLKSKEYYEPPYYLGYHKLNREYFSVVHTGEGDAWDVNRPCMASMIMFQGKIYLVDAGPDLVTSMNAMGVSINEVAGIFNTHAHDDHFAGLMSFVRSDHRIKYFATPLVRASVSKKLCALMSMQEESFHRFFDVEDLEFDVWNNIEGLEVMPLLSPHPVETNIFYFRTFWQNRYFSYGHLADISSMRVLEQNIFKNTNHKHFDLVLNKTKNDYLMTTDLKKIDIGGGMIHGDAKDFDTDKTPKILLAHISRQLKNEEKQIGSFAPFGSVDSLIETHHDFLRTFAQNYLRFYFPEVPDYEILSLLNCPMVDLNAGDTLFRNGIPYDYVYLLLTGAVELVYPDTGVENYLSAGSLVGFYIDDQDYTPKATCRATCYITALQIPVGQYLAFVKRHNLVESFNAIEEKVLTLSNTWLFSENISLPVYIKLAQQIHIQNFLKGEHFSIFEGTGLYLVTQGRAALLTADGAVIENLKRGDFFGAENSFSSQANEFEIFFLDDTEIYHLPMKTVLNIPIVYWKLRDIAVKRNATLE
ncbi:MAG: cyclic nucleotide-binding domain-containing protein [Microscillaceae bacterium]|nr:cyclic nucleotide-binding domain-containing protein [Microscillaceae bacterium]